MPALTPTFRRVTPPTALAVSVGEMREHLRTEQHEDSYLESVLIPTAISSTEDDAGVALMSQQWELRLADWCQVIPLPIVPVGQVDSIDYTDDQDQPATVDPANYQLVDRTIEFARDFTFPSLSNKFRLGLIVVKWTAGFGADCSATPPKGRSASLLMGAHLYEYRGDSEAPKLEDSTYQRLIDGLREDII